MLTRRRVSPASWGWHRVCQIGVAHQGNRIGKMIFEHIQKLMGDGGGDPAPAAPVETVAPPGVPSACVPEPKIADALLQVYAARIDRCLHADT